MVGLTNSATAGSEAEGSVTVGSVMVGSVAMGWLLRRLPMKGISETSMSSADINMRKRDELSRSDEVESMVEVDGYMPELDVYW